MSLGFHAKGIARYCQFPASIEASDDQVNRRSFEVLKDGGTQNTIAYDPENLTVHLQTSGTPAVHRIDLMRFALVDISLPVT